MIEEAPDDEPRVSPERACRRCGETRISMLVKSKRRRDGVATLCRACKRDHNREMRSDPAYRAREVEHNRERTRALAARSDDQIRIDQARLRPDNTQRCRKCREDLPLSAFSANRHIPAGIRYTCRNCDNVKLRRIAEPLWAMLEIDHDTCAYCPEPATSVDHLLAQSKQGPDRGTNLAPCCKSHNSSKNNRPLREFIADKDIDPWLREIMIGFADWWAYIASGRGILTRSAVAEAA